MKSFNKLILSGISISLMLLVALTTLLISEYRFFNTQAQELVYLQEQYRKAITMINEAIEINTEIDEKKKSMILSLLQ